MMIVSLLKKLYFKKFLKTKKELHILEVGQDTVDLQKLFLKILI